LNSADQRQLDLLRPIGTVVDNQPRPQQILTLAESAVQKLVFELYLQRTILGRRPIAGQSYRQRVSFANQLTPAVQKPNIARREERLTVTRNRLEQSRRGPTLPADSTARASAQKMSGEQETSQ
jgi:hypothetical protein